MEPIETFKTAGGTVIRIYPDEDPESPRNWDNLGTMVCFHRRYLLGDKHGLKSDHFSGWDEIAEYLRKEEGAEIILPLYLFDHSGISIKTTTESFRAADSAGWDWGQVGFIYVSRETLKREYKAKRITPQIRKKAEEVLRGEVETYNEYLSGEVYGYVIEGPKCGECGQEKKAEQDSCWGFYGLAYCIQEGKAAAEAMERKK